MTQEPRPSRFRAVDRTEGTSLGQQAQGSLAHSISVREEERDRAAPVSGDGDGGLSGLLT